MSNAFQIMSEGCAGNCEFVVEELSTTLAGWRQRYDRDGNKVGPKNPNRTRHLYCCLECGKAWTSVEKAGKVISMRLEPDGK